MDAFRHFIRSLVQIPDDELDRVLQKCRRKMFSKGKLILKKGQIATQYFYILSGGIRFFYGEDEEEVTTWVVLQGEFLTEISSLSVQKPTRFNIACIEDTELLIIDKADMEALYREIPAWQEFGRKVWEQVSVRMIDQILNFQTLSAEERYLAFMDSPELLQKVPVKQLAKVLGITPNALSRIRKNLR